MEDVGSAVFFYMRVGKLKVIIEVFVIKHIPSLCRKLAVIFRTAKELGVYLFKVSLRRSRIPMSYSAAILGVNEVALKGIRKKFFTKLSSIFQRPEGCSVVVIYSRFGIGIVKLGIRNDIGKCLLENIEESFVKNCFLMPLSAISFTPRIAAL